MKYVLFVCTHNAGRSQIAQAFFERYALADIRAESAGEEPAAAIWPRCRGDARGRDRHQPSPPEEARP
jgi:protein-tyrosine-phosphatase